MSFACSEQPGWFLWGCPCASDSTARPRVQVTTGEGEKIQEGKGNGPVSPRSLSCPDVFLVRRREGEHARLGKAAEAFPCRNQLSPGEKGRRFSDGQVIGLTNACVLQLIYRPAARRLTTPAPNSFSLPWAGGKCVCSQ